MSNTEARRSAPMPQPARLTIMDTPLATHELGRRDIAVADGLHYRIFSAVPKGPAPADGWPVLYMLDGNAAFDALCPDHLAIAHGLAIFGIGYETPLRFDRAARSRDYTPPLRGSSPHPDPNRPDRLAGGAATFVSHLVGDIVPDLERDRPVDPARRSIWGHSLGGLCVLFALLTRPGTFSRYVPVSPSLWWGDEIMADLERGLAAHAVGRAEVLMLLGDSERRSSAEGPHWDGPAPHTIAMRDRLGLRDGLRVRSHVFVGAGHAATLPASIEPALRFASR